MKGGEKNPGVLEETLSPHKSAKFSRFYLKQPLPKAGRYSKGRMKQSDKGF